MTPLSISRRKISAGRIGFKKFGQAEHLNHFTPGWNKNKVGRDDLLGIELCKIERKIELNVKKCAGKCACKFFCYQIL